MRIIVSDASCLIDLRKADLLTKFLDLSYDLVIPDVILLEELQHFSEHDLSAIQNNMTVAGLPGDGVARVIELERNNPALSVNDCFAYVVAERNPGAVLLTGDGKLRKVAESSGIEAHGILWALDEMFAAKLVTAKNVREALEMYDEDPFVRLPKQLLAKWRRKYRKK